MSYYKTTIMLKLNNDDLREKFISLQNKLSNKIDPKKSKPHITLTSFYINSKSDIMKTYFENNKNGKCCVIKNDPYRKNFEQLYKDKCKNIKIISYPGYYRLFGQKDNINEFFFSKIYNITNDDKKIIEDFINHILINSFNLHNTTKQKIINNLLCYVYDDDKNNEALCVPILYNDFSPHLSIIKVDNLKDEFKPTDNSVTHKNTCELESKLLNEIYDKDKDFNDINLVEIFNILTFSLKECVIQVNY